VHISKNPVMCVLELFTSETIANNERVCGMMIPNDEVNREEKRS